MSAMSEGLPDRLSTNPSSPHYDEALLLRGIGVRFNGVEKTNVDEYCVSEGWVCVAAGKAKPGSLNYSTAGVGSASHFGAVRLAASAGFEAQHIPFRGAAEAVTEVVAERADFSAQLPSTTLQLIGEGKLVALAVSAGKRAASMPQVPTTRGLSSLVCCSPPRQVACASSPPTRTASPSATCPAPRCWARGRVCSCPPGRCGSSSGCSVRPKR